MLLAPIWALSTVLPETLTSVSGWIQYSSEARRMQCAVWAATRVSSNHNNSGGVTCRR